MRDTPSTSRKSADQRRRRDAIHEFRIPNSEFQISEQYFKGPLHRSRAALRDDWIAGIDVGRRRNRSEHAAAKISTLRTAEVHAIEQIENLPARLDARSS